MIEESGIIIQKKGNLIILIKLASHLKNSFNKIKYHFESLFWSAMATRIWPS